MGLFSSPAMVYKPVAEVDLYPGSDEFYISPNVEGAILAASCRFYAEFGVLNSVFGVEENSVGMNTVLGVYESSADPFCQILHFLILVFDV
jgi:hypothetical protein